MRNLKKLFAVAIAIVAFTATSNAQTLKFGHIDTQALLPIMPEYQAAIQEFNDFQAELEDVYSDLQEMYQQKYQELNQMAADTSTSEVRINAKLEEVQNYQQNIQTFEQTYQQKVQTKNSELMQPIYEKAINAVEEVAKENGLIYVFDTSTGATLYQSNQSLDILPLVKQKLGLQ